MEFSRHHSYLLLWGSATTLVLTGYSWAALLPISILLGSVVAPSRNMAEAWPYGLLVFQAATYLVYIGCWLFGLEGLNQPLSTFILLVISLAAVVATRWTNNGNEATEFVPMSLLVAGGVSLLFFITMTKPVTLINAHLGGGDHSNHVAFAYSMISHFERAPLPDPLEIFGYPHSLHFMVAIISGSAVRSFDGSGLGLVFRDFAFVDALTCLAIAQASINCMSRFGVRVRVFRSLVAAFPLLSLLFTPDLLAHFWLSGFSTSLNALFILVVLVCRSLEDGERHSPNSELVFATFMMFGVYQPFAVALATLAILRCLWSFIDEKRAAFVRAFSISIAPGAGIIVIFLLAGSGSSPVQTLLRDGAYLRPNLLLFWSVFAVLVLVSLIRTGENPAVDIGLSVFSLTTGFYWAADHFGATATSNYYVGKLVWTSVALGVILVSFIAIEMIFRLTFQRNGVVVASILGTALLLVPIGLGQNPLPHLKFVEGRWFVNHLMNPEFGKSFADGVALNPADRFTSHLANIAMTAESLVAHDFDLQLLDNRSIDELCDFAVANGVKTVFTTVSGLQELSRTSCSRLILEATE